MTVHDPGTGPVPDVDLDAPGAIEADALSLLPEGVCRHFRILPIRHSCGVITIAMADPGDAMARDVALALGGDPITIVRAPAEQIDARIDALSAEDRTPGEAEVAAAFAEQMRVPLLDPAGLEIERSALAEVGPALREELRCVPLALDGSSIHLAIAGVVDETWLERSRGETGREPALYVVTRSELAALAEEAERIEAETPVEPEAAAGPEVEAEEPAAPAAEATPAPTPAAGPGIWAILLALVVAGVAGGLALALEDAPTGITIALAAIAGIGLVAAMIAAGSARPPQPEGVSGAIAPEAPTEASAPAATTAAQPVTGPDVPALPERHPIVVPLFDSPERSAAIVENLAKLGHPGSRIEILLICEEDAESTIAAVREAELPAWFRLLVVPPGHGDRARAEVARLSDPG